MEDPYRRVYKYKVVLVALIGILILLSLEYIWLLGECNRLRLKVTELEVENAGLKVYARSLEAEKERLLNETTRLTDKVSQLTREKKALEDRLSDIEETLAWTRRRLSKLKSAIESLNEEFSIDRIASLLLKFDEMSFVCYAVEVVSWRDVRYIPAEKAVRALFDRFMLDFYYAPDSYYPVLNDVGGIIYYRDRCQTPGETAELRCGDCEDLAVLFAALVNYLLKGKAEAYVIVYWTNKYGHAAVLVNISNTFIVADPAGCYISNMRVLLKLYFKRGIASVYPVDMHPGLKQWLIRQGVASLSHSYLGVASYTLQGAIKAWLRYWEVKPVKVVIIKPNKTIYLNITN